MPQYYSWVPGAWVRRTGDPRAGNTLIEDSTIRNNKMSKYWNQAKLYSEPILDTHDAHTRLVIFVKHTPQQFFSQNPLRWARSQELRQYHRTRHYLHLRLYLQKKHAPGRHCRHVRIDRVIPPLQLLWFQVGPDWQKVAPAQFAKQIHPSTRLKTINKSKYRLCLYGYEKYKFCFVKLWFS